MPNFNRPRGREKNVSGSGKDVFRRGSGLGSGPVGKGSGNFNHGNSGDSSGSFGIDPGGPGATGGGNRGGRGFGSSFGGGSGKRGGGLPIIIALVVLLLGGGGLGVNNLFGSEDEVQQYVYDYYNSGSDYYGNGSTYQASTPKPTAKPTSKPTPKPTENVSGGYSFTHSSDSASQESENTVSSSASGAREKFTKLKGSGKDTVTVMVYMCGTDLESKSGMATSDLSEMAKADLGDKVNVIVYTGGCTGWQNNIVSSDTNQIYQVKSGGLKQLEKNAGKKAMTDPATLTGFIRYCAENFPADRNELIFWDHGGGSLSGFGYDQKFSSYGSMTLSGIDKALKNAGEKFDFIGFDACLMGTAENALMLSDYADYLIASEETEPGTGWYYTNWLNKLSKNTSVSTLELGRQIIDDFVDVTARTTSGQTTTLSITDLAELAFTVPEKLRDFAVSTFELINGDDYAKVSDARSSAKEFSRTSRLDQVDLVHLSYMMDTKESKKLALAVTGAVKYNRTSADIANAYGLSIYFPYRNTSKVSSAVKEYEEIGIDGEYSRCIQAFASMEYAGQSSSGGSSYSSYNSILDYYGASSDYGSGSSISYDSIYNMLESFMNGYSGYGRSFDTKKAAKYIQNNRFDPRQLVWSRGKSGYEMSMTEDNWSKVHDLELNVFYDDGEGFIDLGLDNVFDFTDKGALKGEFDGTWLAINEQPVAYYHLETLDDGTNYTITGRVPAMYNGDRANLILVFDNENPYGYVAGVRYDYKNGETDTAAKSITEISDGDRIDFLCDYYTYNGEYIDSYMLGNALTVKGKLKISNVYLPDADAAMASYKVTDLYSQSYWTPVIPG